MKVFGVEINIDLHIEYERKAPKSFLEQRQVGWARRRSQGVFNEEFADERGAEFVH